LVGLIKTEGVSFLEIKELTLRGRRHLMSVKPLDFSKPNLVRDFREVKRMFKEVVYNNLCKFEIDRKE
jgi:hypothetical protein